VATQICDFYMDDHETLGSVTNSIVNSAHVPRFNTR